MPLYIDKVKIEDYEIKNEMDQMREQYSQTFSDQSRIEREKTLFDWAGENIVEQVLLKEYAKKHIKVTKSEIDQGLKDRNISSLNEKGAFEVELKLKKLIDQIVEKASKIAPADVRKYYENHSDQFVIREQRHVKHIVIHPQKGRKTEDNPLQILKKAKEELNSGAKFESVGEKYSDCPGSGLDLGYFSRGEMVPAFEEVAFLLEIGEVSKIFITEFGHHIARLYDIKPTHKASFELVQNQIFEKLKEEKGEKSIEIFVDQLKTKAVIQYKEPKNKAKSATAGYIFKKPLNSLLIKPAGPDCNLACSYCFYLRKDEMFKAGKKRMDLKTAKHLVKQAADQSFGYVNFSWQGGEPSLMGLDFFREVVKYQEKWNKDKFGNNLQTNGILLNEEWAEFLREKKFLVGLSLDGQEHVHNKYRIDSGGNGTWQKVINTAKLLFEKGVAVNSVSVINNYSAGFATETYSFLKETGFRYLQFIPVVEINKEGNTVADYSVAPLAYGRFLTELFSLWKTDFSEGKPQVFIRFFEAIFHKYVGKEAPDCVLQKECGNYLVIEHNGDVFPCDFFVDPENKLGNISTDNLLELLNSENQEKFGKTKTLVSKECRECEWEFLCSKGCPKDRIMEAKKISYLCEGYKYFFEQTDKEFKKLAKSFL